jgi:hypothetical protein
MYVTSARKQDATTHCWHGGQDMDKLADSTKLMQIFSKLKLKLSNS